MTGVKRSRANTTMFAHHQLVPRFSGGVIAGYQMTCRSAGHYSCKKELAISVGGTAENTRRVLKTWVLMGYGMANRSEHMSTDLKTVLLEKLKSNEMLDERSLDELALADPDSLSTPFSHPERSTASTAPQTSMGECGEDAPEALHTEMTRLASQGLIPFTSSQQRLRNRRTRGSTYGVPADLSDALRFGYISPNLPPPSGMQWRHRSGAWVLEHRGC